MSQSNEKMRSEICTKIAEKKGHFFNLSNSCGKTENSIANELFPKLGFEEVKKESYGGLFGWKEFKTDKYIKTNNGLLIIELKKVVEGREYGYWHALIQGLIYFYQHKNNLQNEDEEYLILCIVLDWGRKAGKKLSDSEKEFINIFNTFNIYFLRVSMGENKFIEHNLNINWQKLNNDNTFHEDSEIDR